MRTLPALLLLTLATSASAAQPRVVDEKVIPLRQDGGRNVTGYRVSARISGRDAVGIRVGVRLADGRTRWGAPHLAGTAHAPSVQVPFAETWIARHVVVELPRRGNKQPRVLVGSELALPVR